MATELPITQCTLDQAGAREQATRYAEVAKHVETITRTSHTLIAAVDAEVDETVLGDLLATERACCTFFEITWDDSKLTYAIAHDEHAPALDVIAEAISG